MHWDRAQEYLWHTICQVYCVIPISSSARPHISIERRVSKNFEL